MPQIINPKIITRPLLFEPYGQPPYPNKPHGAVSFDRETYWAGDNGFWDSDPPRSDASDAEQAAANNEESIKVSQLLSDEACAVLRDHGFLVR